MKVIIYSEDPDFKPIVFETDWVSDYDDPCMIHIDDDLIHHKLYELLPYNDEAEVWKAKMILKENSEALWDAYRRRYDNHKLIVMQNTKRVERHLNKKRRLHRS